jgi:hypothetical protein
MLWNDKKSVESIVVDSITLLLAAGLVFLFVRECHAVIKELKEVKSEAGSAD